MNNNARLRNFYIYRVSRLQYRVGSRILPRSRMVFSLSSCPYLKTNFKNHHSYLFCCHYLWSRIQKISPSMMTKHLPSMSSRVQRFLVLHLSPDPFWVNFCVVYFNSFPWGYPVSPIPFFKEIVLSTLYILVSFVVN